MLAMEYVAPIDEIARHLVLARTRHFFALAESLFDCHLPPLPVRFDLKGRSSGMYRVRGRQREIRYNPWIFAAHIADCLANTGPHEVAHYVVDLRFGLRHVRPHGNEWKAVMTAFGASTRATSNLSLAGIPGRRMQTFDYRCGCTLHSIGIRRHRRVLRGQATYNCRRCGGRLERVR